MKLTRKRLVFLTTIVALAVAAIAGVALIRHGFSARDNPSWIETVMARTARRMAVPARAKEMTSPVPGTAENLKSAGAHWADHSATCHANNGSGDTVIGNNLYLGPLALAHGNDELVVGTVTKISASSIIVETTAKKSVEVAVDEKTKFETSSQPATLHDLTEGDRVVIHAGKSGNKLIAHTVKFGPAQSTAAPGHPKQ